MRDGGNKTAGAAHGGSNVPRVQSIAVEYEDGQTKRVVPPEFGEVTLIFRDGRIVEDQKMTKNKWF